MDQRIIQILSDSFTQLLIPGICVTIPLTLISFAIGLVVAVAIALIRTAKTPVLEPLARIYVWIFRGTPALVQLFVIFFWSAEHRHCDRRLSVGRDRLFAQCGRLCF